MGLATAGKAESAPNISYVNTAKGIGIILVVLGHTLVPEIRSNSTVAMAIYQLIYAFHMRMFFMLSGLLFAQHQQRYIAGGFGHFAGKKFQSLMLPYLSFSVISYLGLGVAFKVPLLGGVLVRAGYEPFTLWQALRAILTYEGHIDKHLWFGYILFLVTIAAYLIHRRAWTWVMTLPLLVVSCVVFGLESSGVDFWFILYYVLMMLGYYSFGKFVPALTARLRRPGLAALGYLAAFALGYWVSRTSPLVWVGAVADAVASLGGSLLFITLSVFLDKTPLRAPLQMLGRYSYDIFLMHQPFIVSGVAGVLLMATSLPYLVICAITFVLGIAIPLLASKLVIRKIKYLKLFLLGSETR